MMFRLLLFWLLSLAVLGCARAESAAPPSDLAQRALSHPDFRWDSLASPGLTTYVHSTSLSGAAPSDLHRRAGEGLRHALDLLGEKSYPGHLRVFRVASREQMRLLTGTAVTGMADPLAHTVIVVENEQWRGFVRHEIMHTVSLLLWGEPSGSGDSDEDRWRNGGWVREGVAALAEDRCAAYSNRGMAAAMEAEGGLLPLRLLVDSFYEQDDFAAYLQAGSLVEYLLTAHGRDRLRQVWRSGSLEVAYGKPAAQVEAEWVRWLRATPAQMRPPSVQGVRSQGCG